MPQSSHRVLVTALSLAGFVLFWAGLAVLRADAQILSAPPAVLAAIWAEAVSGRQRQAIVDQYPTCPP